MTMLCANTNFMLVLQLKEYHVESMGSPSLRWCKGFLLIHPEGCFQHIVILKNSKSKSIYLLVNQMIVTIQTKPMTRDH